ncbi:NAD(P)H-dependent oxidoreductase [Oceanobacter mangrovi]|uniref:NAD(P)H-dependent oxidoreductase n=1 Tax=Oceanobacter mangrovi TaxID=2862510 RepID=UPI001C8EB15E|nr:NAD(P)H-dependent oxidoreductase [Oceanobacter mangrovi]
MMKLLILNGNPKPRSLCRTLADSYVAGAATSADIRRFELGEMAFDPVLQNGYDTEQALEPDLQEFLQALQWAEHIVIVAPVWWGGIPAVLKGLIDRTFLPGQTFRYQQQEPQVVPLLAGKTSQLLLTMDAPAEFAQQQAGALVEQLNRFTLQFCGVETLAPVLFSSVSFIAASELPGWQSQVEQLAKAQLERQPATGLQTETLV